MAAAFRRLSDERRSFPRLHVVGEGFGGGERVRTRQDEEGNVEARLHADIAAGPDFGQGPGLTGERAEELGRIRQEIAAQIIPRSAAVLPDIDDDGPGIRQEHHRGHGHIFGLVEGVEASEIDIADPRLDPVQPIEAGVLLCPQAVIADGVMQGAGRLLPDIAGHDDTEVQVLVAGDRDEIGVDLLREFLGIGQPVIGSRVAFCPEFVGESLGLVREDVLALDSASFSSIPSL